MAASEHLSPRCFFHGSAAEFEPGELVDPAQEIGVRRGQRAHAYMTSSTEAAQNYGRYKADALRAGYGEEATGHVYEVEPTGPYEKDPAVAEKFGAYRSRHPLRVVRELHEPEMG